MSKRLVVAAIGDLHANSKLAIMRPGIELPPFDTMSDVYIPQATEIQRWEYDEFQKHKQGLIDLADKSEIFFIVGGDITHGKRYPNKERVSVRAFDDFAIAADILGELAVLKNVKQMRIVKGTGSHVYSHGTSELIVARILNAQHKVDARVAYHYSINIRGVEFDIAHHGPGPGIRNWLKGNVLRLYVRSIVMGAVMARDTVPDVLLRWHYHQYIPETHEFRPDGMTYKTLARICPSYAYVDEHARQTVKSPSKLTVGMLAFEIENKKVVKDHEFLSDIDLRRREIFK
jgi:hypothetical protein